MVLDIIFLAVIIIFIISGAVRGLAKSIMNIAALVASYILSNLLSGVISDWIFNAFIRNNLIKELSTAVTNTEISVNSALGDLPSWVSEIVTFFCNIFGFDEQRLIDCFAGKTTSSNLTAVQVTDSFVKPIVTGIFSFFIAIIMFILLLIVFKLIIRLVNKGFDLPVISPINRILGGVFGAVEGVILATIFLMVLAVIMDWTNSTAALNEGISGVAFSIFKR